MALSDFEVLTPRDIVGSCRMLAKDGAMYVEVEILREAIENAAAAHGTSEEAYLKRFRPLIERVIDAEHKAGRFEYFDRDGYRRKRITISSLPTA